MCSVSSVGFSDNYLIRHLKNKVHNLVYTTVGNGQTVLPSFPIAMTFIKSGQTWQFATESNLEEVVWRYLPELMNLKPVSRQFCISGKFCDIIAVDNFNRLVIVELKNTEDRYVVQQLVRYYEAIATAETFPFDVDVASPRLVALAPSFHADSFTDCKHSRLEVELMTFSLESSSSGISLLMRDAAGHDLCTLPLQKDEDVSRPEIQISEPPRKLLNWLSDSSDIEHE